MLPPEKQRRQKIWESRAKARSKKMGARPEMIRARPEKMGVIAIKILAGLWLGLGYIHILSGLPTFSQVCSILGPRLQKGKILTDTN